jgi:hypothetical protein
MSAFKQQQSLEFSRIHTRELLFRSPLTVLFQMFTVYNSEAPWGPSQLMKSKGTERIEWPRIKEDYRVFSKDKKPRLARSECLQKKTLPEQCCTHHFTWA